MSASLLQIDGEEKLALSECRAVYVNNSEHLDLLYAAGLPGDCAIRTASPALAWRLGGDVDRLGAELTSKDILALLERFDALSQQVFVTLRDLEPAGLALSVATAVWRCQRIAYDALLFRQEDLEAPVCVPKVTGSTAFLSLTLDFEWHKLLDGHPNVTSPLITVDAGKLPYVEPPDSSWLNRFALNGLGAVFFRAQLALPQLDKLRDWSGRLYCQRDPDLLKDAGLELYKAGIRLAPAGRLKPDPEAEDDAVLAETVLSRIEDMIAETLSIIPDPGMRKAANGLVRSEAQATAANYARLYRSAARKVDALPDMPSGFASSTIASAADIATAVRFQQRGWPVVTFSHGATRRISDNHDRNFILHEDVTSDHFFTFVEDAEEDEIPVERCGKTVVGAPRFYKSRPRTGLFGKPEGVWYISSGLYMAGSDKLHRAMSDHAQCDFETRVMTEILGKCGKQVTVKPYPALRYLDPDPVLEAAEQAGLEIFRSAGDLRYHIHKPALLITSRSGSTIGYCLCQDKPMVYIEAPGRPLRADVRPVFEEAVFVFNAEAADFEDSMRDFLSKPITEIEALWKDKAAARRHLVDNYIAAPVPNGPQLTAERLADLLDHGHRGSRP
ncbi:hypothetical protein [Hwanghaeella sp.]|uniref:hypothetical protein n=1 Tax=Hwanghaeella sp. TaxID=2605943 RepID=UPI003CCBE6B0